MKNSTSQNIGLIAYTLGALFLLGTPLNIKLSPGGEGLNPTYFLLASVVLLIIATVALIGNITKRKDETKKIKKN